MNATPRVVARACAAAGCILMLGAGARAGAGTLFAQEAGSHLVPTRFEFSADIARQTGRNFSRGMCASQPLTHDAPVWSVLVGLRAEPPSGAVWIDPNFESYRRVAAPAGAADTLYLPYFEGSEASIPLSHAGRDYRFETRLVLGTARVEVQGLTLAEVGEVVELLADNPTIVHAAFEAGGVSVTVYKVWADNVDVETLYETLYSDFDPVTGPRILLKRLQAAESQAQTVVSAFGDTVTFESASAPPRTLEVESLQLDRATLSVARANARTLAERGAGSSGDSAGSQVWIVDEPCFQLSVAPATSGDEVVTATNFRGRYDFLTKSGKGSLRLRADGDAGQGGDYFQRVEVRGEAGYNHQASTWLLSFGGVGSYSFTRSEGETADEWRAGGKLRVHVPNMTGILSALPGAGTSPVLGLEFGATGGDASSTGTTDAYALGTLAYTSRPSMRLYLDVNGSLGWSNEPRFAGEESFEYVSVTARFNISGDWDYLVRYECGRKSPDYAYFCGWQTGADLVTGR